MNPIAKREVAGFRWRNGTLKRATRRKPTMPLIIDTGASKIKISRATRDHPG
jgi:hypothetical protein